MYDFNLTDVSELQVEPVRFGSSNRKKMAQFLKQIKLIDASGAVKEAQYGKTLALYFAVCSYIVW